MAANSQGIQTLLEAEKEASKIVAKARQYRVDKLKEARTEAAKEIDELKARRASEFQTLEQGGSGSADAFALDIAKDTEKSIKDIRGAFNANKSKVIDLLVEKATVVDTKVHPNVLYAAQDTN